MPGAPNRPPEPELALPPPPSAGTPAERVLRRITPSRIALQLDLWKGNPSPDLLKPYESAEAAFASGDLPHAEGALDQLAVRFAEPRWPTLPIPFKGLRQEIPAPMPPSWDPENALSAPEREAHKILRTAELQLKLVEACVAWAASHGVPSDDLIAPVEEAKARYASESASVQFWASIDQVWTALRERVPRPKGSARPTPAPEPDPL
jgi:hypothetical protein